MNESKFLLSLCCLAMLAAPTQRAVAQCVIDFDDFPPGEIVTTQYPGVTFSLFGEAACGPNTSAHARIGTPAGGSSSPPYALMVDNASPPCQFNELGLRVVLDRGVNRVEFTLGDTPGTYIIETYDAPSGGTRLSRQGVTVVPGVHRLVRLGWLTPSIRRIEIQHTNNGQEAIDDLRIIDETPPTAIITTPPYRGCGCETVYIEGIACDEDGAYGFDRAEFRAVNAPATEPWTIIGAFVTPQCEGGTLYEWNTAGLAEGEYYVRLTVENACGLRSEDRTVVHIDREFDVFEVRQPLAAGVYGGRICIDGSAWDHRCFQNYRVSYRPAGSSEPFRPVDPDEPVYATPILNDPLATWNTASGPAAVADGEYSVRVRGMTQCGNIEQSIVNVIVDNTRPEAIITRPFACDYLSGAVIVRGTANDANLDRWELAYSVPGSGEWELIASGTTPVINNRLARWETAQLPACAYALRLRVWDRTLPNCDDDLRTPSEYVVSFNIGSQCDINGDGVVDAFDIDPFIMCLFAP